MTCPHCGYQNPDQSAQCQSCGYLLKPPEVPKHDYRFIVVVVMVLLVLAGFIAAALSFAGRADSMISFFGKRGYFDLAAGTVVLRPGEVKAFSLRNPARTPVCRLYGRVASDQPGTSVMVLDSANLGRLIANQPFTAFATLPVAGPTRFSAQTEKGEQLHHIVLRLSESARDSVTVQIERMQAACFEPW